MAWRALLPLALLAASSAWGQRLPEPVCPQPYVDSPFSGGRTVRLLSEMLTRAGVGEDPLLRERVVADLARTCNPQAGAFIRQAFADADWHVQAAAARAAGDLPLEWTGDLLASALASKNNRVAAEAVRSAVRRRFVAGAAALAALAQRDDDRLAALAVTALTDLGLPLAPEAIARLLGRGPATVQLAALRNARLARDIPPVVQAVEPIARGDNPLLRGEALACLARLGGEAHKAALLAAASDADWRVRAGVAEGLGYIGPGAVLRGFLRDPAPAVRLSGCRAVERLKDPLASEALWEDLADPIDAVHFAARDALVSVGSAQLATGGSAQLATGGTSEVASHAGERLRVHGEKVLPRRGRPAAASAPRAATGPNAAPGPQTQPAQPDPRRLAMAESYILGELKSHEGYDFHLSLLTALNDYDALVGQVGLSLGKIGDARAGEAFTAYLASTRKVAHAYFLALASMQTPAHDFNEEAYGQVLRGLARLGGPEAYAEIAETLTFIQSNRRFTEANVAAIQALDGLADRVDRAAAGDLLAGVIKGRGYDHETLWRAAHLLGKLKAPQGLGPLRDLLENRRPSRELMAVAAWAIQETTGETPKVGEPVIIDSSYLTITSETP